MRFAGTWKQYSTKAIPQLARITIHRGESLYLRCPYQAIVMNILDTVNRKIVCMKLTLHAVFEIYQCVSRLDESEVLSVIFQNSSLCSMMNGLIEPARLTTNSARPPGTFSLLIFRLVGLVRCSVENRTWAHRAYSPPVAMPGSQEPGISVRMRSWRRCRFPSAPVGPESRHGPLPPGCFGQESRTSRCPRIRS